MTAASEEQQPVAENVASVPVVEKDGADTTVKTDIGGESKEHSEATEKPSTTLDVPVSVEITQAASPTAEMKASEQTPAAEHIGVHGDAPSVSETTTIQASESAAPGTEGDLINPPDFQGEVQTNNEIPTQEDLKGIENYTVLDRDGKTRPFKSLYSGRNVPRRVLIIFVRHFFCDNCQEYLRTLSASISPDELLSLPVSTFVAVIGCGSHELIDAYIKETNCPFPVYADPTRRLYTELGMVRTLTMGPKPAYLQKRTMAHTVLSGLRQGLKQIHTGLASKNGDLRQVGGEFLFEPAAPTLDTPISSPTVEAEKKLGEEGGPGSGNGDDLSGGAEGEEKVENKRVTWCHRMKTTRDHAEIPELREILGLEGDGAPARDGKRWQKAVKTRKGTGLSMASQMSRPSMDAAPAPAPVSEAVEGGGN
ncbi:hypothetical protein F5Y16DRAFT_198823 [Xylariaceae sp. FL0255]|nr:hypothetical protein F5Y16DRAFT_198823 [Xylariaceae sp. FL0255]